MEIKNIHDCIKQGLFFKIHATEVMNERDIEISEIKEALISGEIIEEYPDDKYGPTCLIFGLTKQLRPLHILVTYTIPLWVITTYEPDEQLWINYKVRKK
ncbi:MAG: DUF4258 domain-containing protein [Ignavibacteriae bacterium]|nr:DUF4258 domain-containing protein [Ignavibacteriota bacterium]